MDRVDQIIVFVALSAVVVVLVWEHGGGTGFGDPAAPADRMNASNTPSVFSEPGPAYLVSNLPVRRTSDDVIPFVSLGAMS